MVNRLADSTSPYLLQHADNPVDWWPWGPEAFTEAERRDVPVLISIGYATCHWCHVMAAESFSDEDTAAQLADGFVSIKVDSEELPAVDSYYMDALQAMRGTGGWPMTIIADSAGRPFFAGTYFPLHPRQGSPSFRQVLTAITNTWEDERAKVDEIAGHLTSRLTDFADSITAGLPAGTADEPLSGVELTAAAEQLANTFDRTWGGFGPAPKFPPLMTMMQLIRRAGRTGDHGVLDMVRITMTRMATGGMRDQVEGGIARYSVDAHWNVPHFEKMLFDNALYLRAHTEWFALESAIAARTSARAPAKFTALAQREATDTAEFLLRSLRAAGGTFASGLDADSRNAHGESVEGAYYTYPLAEAADYEHFALAGDVDGYGVVARPRIAEWIEDDAESATDLPWEDEEALAEQRRLGAARADRELPHLDDKAVTEWNGLAITALARASAVIGRPRWAQAAGDAFEALLRTCDLEAMTIPRSSRGARPGPGASGLADFVALGRAALALREAGVEWPSGVQWSPGVDGPSGDDGSDADGHSGDDGQGAAPDFLAFAVRIGRHIADTFLDVAADPLTCVDGVDDVIGTKVADPIDNSRPAGRSSAAELFLQLAELTVESGGGHSWAELAHRLLGGYRALAAQSPRGCGWALYLSEQAATGPVRVATADPELAQSALRHPAVFTVDAHGPELADPATGRTRTDVAVVCRGTTCSLPLTSEQALIAELDTMTAL